jgi:hypothetical protein
MKKKKLARELYLLCRESDEITLEKADIKFVKSLIEKQFPELKPLYKITHWLIGGAIVILAILAAILSACTPLI